MVRPVPRTTRRRASAIAALSALALAPILPAAHADDLKHRQREVKQRISSQRTVIDESSQTLTRARAELGRAQSQLSSAQDRLARTRTALSRARIEDAAMQVKLQQAELNLSRAEDRLRVGRERVAQQRQEISRMAVQTYQDGDPQLLGLQVILDSQSPQSVTTQMQTVNDISERQTRVLHSYQQVRDQLAAEERHVQDARDNVASQRDAAARNLQLRRQLESAAVSARASVVSLVRTQRAAANSAVAALRADQAQLSDLQGESARIRHLIMARAQAQRTSYSGSTGGYLAWPASGPVTSPYGYRLNPVMHYWGLHDGIDIGAGCGQPLMAAGNGTIVSEYYSSVWGNRLILNVGTVNGHNVSVIYNHISAYTAGQGEQVSRGETIARVGTTGWSTGCHLHFTVMVDGVPQDPMGWL